MKKRLLSLALILSLLAGLIVVTPVITNAATSGIYTYTVSGGKATITDCDSSASGDIVIPSTLGGYPVTKIAGNAFEDCKSLTSVIISDGVTSIGPWAFSDCDSLTDIEIPYSVTNIDHCAFWGCESLKNIEIPDSVTFIGYAAFNLCASLTSIKIPDGVTTIGNTTFHQCTSLTSVTLPDSLKSIDEYAFQYCESLTSIEIPDGVTTIGYGSFYKCTSLTNVTLPDSLTSIDKYAFQYCESLTSIKIPDDVTTIGYAAFSYCGNLISIEIFGRETSIDKFVFKDCASLTSVTLSDGVTSIGGSAFSGCVNVTDVCYGGSREDWLNIDIGDFNDDLINATIHYNYVPGLGYAPNEDASVTTNPDAGYMPVNINMVTINGKGTAYGRYKIYNSNGTVAKKKKVYYSVDGGEKKSTATDDYGYATVEIPWITRSKNYNISFSGSGIRSSNEILIVTVEPLHFKNGIDSSLEWGVTAGAGKQVGAEIGKLKAKAGVFSVSAEGSKKNSLSYEQEYANNKNKITLSSKTNYSAAAEAKLGLFAEAKLSETAGLEGSLAEVKGKAGYGGFVGVSYEDEDFDLYNTEDIINVSKFMLSSFVAMQPGNVVTQYISAMLLPPVNSYEKGSVITLEGGASAGVLEKKGNGINGGVTLGGISGKSVWTNSTKTLKDDSHIYSTEVVFGGGSKVLDAKIGYSKAKGSLGSKSDFTNDNLKFSATENKNGKLEEITLSTKQIGDDGSFLYKKTETTKETIKFKDEAARKVANSYDQLSKFSKGNKAYLNPFQMKKAVDTILNTDQSGTYSRAKNVKEALSLDLSASVQLLLKLGGKLGMSGSSYYEYEYENGIYENGTAYIQAKNDIKDDVESLTISFDEMKDMSVDWIVDMLSGIWDTVKGVADKAVEFGQAVVKSTTATVTGWAVSITKAVESIGSVAILAVEDEVSLFSTASLATTIGEPYIIAVEDADGNEVTDFSENPLSLTLSYTEDQISEAGVTDVDSIAVVRWDEDKCVYIKQESVHDRENSSVTLEIVKPGQYILAVDNCPPAITQFEIKGNGLTPEISAIVSDMSGIQDFVFSIDGQEILNKDNFEEYYNPATGEFYYSVEDYEDGEHTATIYAKDTFGNEIEESISFSIDCAAPEISYVTEIPEVITENMTISAEVSDAGVPFVLLNTEITDIYGNTSTVTVDMTETDGEYTAELPEIRNGYSVNVWVSAYSETGNGADSEIQQAVIMKSDNDKPVIAITGIDENGVTVKCNGIEDFDGGIVYLGVYDELGMLLEVKAMPLEEEVTFTDITEKGYIKVFAWDENHSPISLFVEEDNQ